MTPVAISSIQQFTIDRFRISLGVLYEKNRIRELEFKVFDKDNTDITSKLKSIKESNGWTDSELIEQGKFAGKAEVNEFYLYLNNNSYLEAGIYNFVFYEKDAYTSESVMIFNHSLNINYMEDIRTEIGSVIPISINKLKLVFKPLDETNPLYQSKNMMKLMNISVYDVGEDSGTNYNDVFEPLSSTIDNYGEYITELTLTLKNGRVLPKGYYSIKLTTLYKSRTFSVIENTFNIPFLSTTPPHIGSVNITKNIEGETNLDIVFDTFLEYTMYKSAKFYVKDEDGNEVNDKFEALSVSPKYNSKSGVTYITQLSIPLRSDLYTLEKGIYYISFSWDGVDIYGIYDTIDYTYNCKKWFVHSMNTIVLSELDHLILNLPELINMDDYPNIGYIIEKYNSFSDEYVSDETLQEAFGPLHIPDNSDDFKNVGAFQIDIIDKSKLKQDNVYSFITYHVDANGERIYDFIGHIDIVSEITPVIVSVEQCAIDTIKIKLQNELPIEVISYCIPKLLPYGENDYIENLLSIEDSNIWEAGRTKVNEFLVKINEYATLESGQYTFNLLFGNKMLDKPVTLFLQYMETSKGIIDLVEQLSLSEIRVSFSEPQSRRFLLSTHLRVIKVNNDENEGVDYSDRFESVENVLKAGEYAFTELIIPMDHEDSIPSGKYTIELLYLVNVDGAIRKETVYSYDVELGFMTNNIPKIHRISRTIDNAGLTAIKILFSNYLQKELFDCAKITLKDSNGRDVMWKFPEDRDNWTLYKSEGKDDIGYIKSMEIKVRNSEIKIEKGDYILNFSWKGMVKYLDDISGMVSLEYALPIISDENSEVVSYNSAEGKARLYFKFDKTFQKNYFETMQVLALNENGHDHSEYFSSISESNPFDDVMITHTDNINLDVTDTTSITQGLYKFIFYHERSILLSLSTTMVHTVPIDDIINYRYEVIDENGNDISSYFKPIIDGVDSELTEIMSFELYTKDSKNVYVSDNSVFELRLYDSIGTLIAVNTSANIIDIKESDYMGKLDINSTLSPRFAKVEQIGHNKLCVYLKEPIPTMILEEYNFSFFGFNHVDYTSYLDTITDSNNNSDAWDDGDIRFTDYFYLRLRDRCVLENGGYSLTLYAGTEEEVSARTALELDEISFNLQYMEGADCSIKKVSILNLATLQIEFEEPQSIALFDTLQFSIVNGDGIDVSNKFKPFEEILRETKFKYDEITVFNIPLLEDVALNSDIYEIKFTRPGKVENVDLTTFKETLSYMSSFTLAPLIHDVQATKINDDADGLVIWFMPPLAKELYENAIFSIETTSGKSIVDRFVNSSDAILEIDDDNEDGIEYVYTASFELNEGETINRDNYITKCEWVDNYSYVESISRENEINYILLPLESIEMKDSTTLEVRFKSDVEASFLQDSVLVVDSTYIHKNDDGIVVTDVDFTEKFKLLSETNDFSSSESFRKIIVKLKDDEQLPVGTYRIAIAEKIHDENDPRLAYKYAGKIDIEIMTGVDVITNNKCEIVQCGLDTLKLSFENPVNVEIFNKSILKLTGVNPSTIKDENYSGSFMSIKESNKYKPQEKENVNISHMIKDINLRKQYDLSYSGLLDFENVYVFHKEALLAAGIIDEQIITKYITDKYNIPYSRRDEYVNHEADYMLNEFVVTVTKDDAYLTEQSRDTYYDNESSSYIDSDGLKYYYEHAKKVDDVINGIHYISYASDIIYLKLDDGKAIPSGEYSLIISFENLNLVDQTISTTFMTTTPPDIASMRITDKYELEVNFSPYVEETTMFESTFALMIYSGLVDGQPSGLDVTKSFENLSFASFTKIEQRGITYISSVLLPVKPNAFLPSGKYKLDWMWSEYSFLNNISFIGALNVIAKGVKSATMFDNATIKVILSEKVQVSNLKSLEVNVENSFGEDCGELFDDVVNFGDIKDLKDDDMIDTFFIKVEDDEDVITDTYKFMLSFDMPEENTTDDEIISTPAYEFAINIVFMTTEFPSIENIDNLSTKTYTIDRLSKDKADDYYGHYIQPVKSSDKFLLTKENSSQFLDSVVKIFGLPTIDSIYMVFTEEVYPCLLNACTATVINSEGLNVSDKFKSIADSNRFTERQVVDYINITLEKAYDEDYLEKLEVVIYQADGEEITDKFQSIADSNKFEDNIKTRTFKLLVDDEEENIEDYESTGLQIVITDSTGNRLNNFKSSVILKSTNTVTTAKLTLNDGCTLPPDQYTVSLSYQNEPGLDDTVTVIPFTYSGKLPFLSTNLGYIVETTTSDLSKLFIQYSEDLPISLFMDMKMGIYNEDNEDCIDNFKDLQETNDFDGVNMLSQMATPMTIGLELKSGKALSASKYTLQFSTNISAGMDDDGEEEMSDDEKASNDEIADEYILWTHGTALPYMIKTSDNAILDVKQTAIDELKVTLEEPIDLNLLKAFSVAVSNQDTGKSYDVDTFISLKDSNRFGYSVLLTDNRYILYSEDNISWNRFDTGLSVSFNTMIYDETSEKLIISCSNGKLLTISEFNKAGCVTHDTGLTTGLNSIVKIKNKFVGVGTNGNIVVGSYFNNRFTWTTKVSNTKNTLTQVIAVSESELFIVGYKATLLHSTDSGNTWEVIPTPSTVNFNGIVNYKYTPEPEVEDDLTTDDGLLDEEGTLDEDEEDSDADDNSKNRDGIYIVGTKGTILYSPDGKGKWEIIKITTTKNLFGIISYKNKLIAVGDTGTVLVSQDTVTFNAVDSGASFTIRSIAICDEKLIACGMNGKWISSSTGNKWTTNSTVYSTNFKCIGYVPSQYEDNRNIDYFYLKLVKGSEIGRISIHNGTAVPTLENVPAKSWKTENIKNSHIGDVYNLFDSTDGYNVHKKSYQFVMENVYDEETNLLISSEYKWKPIDLIPPSTGNYTFYIVDGESTYSSNMDDTNSINGRKIYFEKSGVQLNYLTSDPGEIRSTTLINPDIKSELSYQCPFVHIEISECNELAVRFSSYEIFNQNGEDCSAYFLPISQGIIDYSDSYQINGINLLGNNETIWDMPAGQYTLVWSWSRGGESNIQLPLTIPKIYRFIKDVKSSVPVINAFQFEIGNIQPSLEYFTGVDEQNSLNLQTRIYKFAMNNKTDSAFNHSNKFMTIMESTDFSDPQYITQDNKISKFNMQLISGNKLTKGKYIIKFTNDITPISEDGSMIVTTTLFNVDIELTDLFPSIQSVSLILYSDVVEGIVNDNANQSEPLIEKYSGTVHPTLTTYYNNWKLMGTTDEWDLELKRHVGDIYTNTDIDKSYSFVRDAYTGDYRWELNVTKPYLIITLGNKCTLDVIARFTNNVIFNEYDEYDNIILNLNNYLIEDQNTWDYDIVTDGEEVYVSKIKIPLDETKSYPGTNNAKFVYVWKNGCIYDNMLYEGIKTRSAIRDYGQIVYVSPVTISGLISSDDEYGLIVKFEKMQFTNFLKNMDWTFTHQTYDAEGTMIDEDVSGYFKSISTSNDEFEGMSKTDSMYLFLTEGQSIDSGTYTLELYGYKTQDDILSELPEYQNNSMIKFTFIVNLPWITGTPPKTFEATFEQKKEGFNYPVLNIKFDVSPPIDAINQFKISVTKAADMVDYTDCFRKHGSSLIKFNYLVEDGVVTKYVESIDIPMKRCRGMKTGTYDVTISFNSDSIIPTLPSDGKVVSFTLEKNIITKMGKIVNMTTKGRDKMIVEFKPDAEVEGGNIATSQVGRVYGWSSWNDAINKDLSLSAINGNGVEKISMFKGPNISGNKLTFTLKSNTKIDPCKLKLGLLYDGYYVISAKKIAFKGLIVNLKASKKDKLCWILVTKHEGTTKKHVYSTYEKAQKRIKKMKKLNKEEKAQVAMCKECRKIKLLATSKIKAQLEKYTFPIGKPLKFFKKAANKFYKYQSKQIGCTEVNIDADIIDDENVGTLACENYIKKATPYSWSLKIATMATKYPKSGKVINFAYHVKNGVQLDRGYKANKKGKKTKKFKKYLKKLNKFIKNYKKKVAKCKKCKKRMIAAKGSTKIGWNAAMFPQYLRTKSSVAKALIKIINKFFKKKKNGCAKANFKFVKKNKNYCKLTCKKFKKTDKTLEYGSYRTYFKK